MPRPELVAYAEALLAELSAKHPLGYQPRLEWRNLRVTAGVAYYRMGVIALSKLVLTEEAAVRSTLIHEYAHLLAVVRYGRRAAGHGEHWKTVMRELGEDPVVRHCYQVTRNESRQQVTYSCLRCGRAIIRARRLPKRRRYVHANCGGDLRLTRIERKAP